MESLDKLVTSHPELESLSLLLHTLHSSIDEVVGELAGTPCTEEAHGEVRSDLRELLQLASDCERETQVLRGRLVPARLSSLDTLQAQLQAEQQRDPELPRAAGIEGLCDSLRHLLESVGEGVSSELDDTCGAWIRDFWHAPREELRRQGQDAQELLEGSWKTEENLERHIRALSQQISQPALRSSLAAELASTRAVLVQQLLSALDMRHGGGALPSHDSREAHRGRMLAFEREHAVSARRLHDDHSHHTAIADDLGGKMESVAKYLQQKDRALNSEQKAASGRRNLRSARMRWISEALQHAFADLIETLHECRSDAARLSRAKLVKTAALELCEKARASLDECRCAHSAYAKQLQTSSEVQERFAEWLRDASAVTIAKASSNTSINEANMIATRARLLTLARSVQGQICVDQSLGPGERLLVDQRAKCSQGDQAGGAEVYSTMMHHGQTAKQQGPMRERVGCQSLTPSKAPEQHIPHDDVGSTRLEEIGDLKGVSEEEWAVQLKDAEAWVTSFLFTNVVGGKDGPDRCQPSPASLPGFSTPRENSAKTKEPSLQGDIRHGSQDQCRAESGMGQHIHAIQVAATSDAAEEESLVVSESQIDCITPESISAISPDRSKMLEAPPSCFLRLRHLQAQNEFREAAVDGNPPGGTGTKVAMAASRRSWSAGPKTACDMLRKAAPPVPTQSSPSSMYCTTRASHAPMRLSATPPAQVRLPRPSSDATLEVPQARTPVPTECGLRLATPLAPAMPVSQVVTRASTPPHPKFFAAAPVLAEPKQHRLSGQQAASCEAPCRMVVRIPHEPIAGPRTVNSYAPVRHSLPADGAAVHGSRAIATTHGSAGPSLDAPKVRAASLPTRRGG